MTKAGNEYLEQFPQSYPNATGESAEIIIACHIGEISEKNRCR